MTSSEEREMESFREKGKLGEKIDIKGIKGIFELQMGIRGKGEFGAGSRIWPRETQQRPRPLSSVAQSWDVSHHCLGRYRGRASLRRAHC